MTAAVAILYRPGEWVRIGDEYWEVLAVNHASIARLRWLGSDYTISVHTSLIDEILPKERACQ